MAGWAVPAGPPPTGRTSDLLCTRHIEMILTSLVWPAGLTVGALSSCPGCRDVADQAPPGLYVPYDRREHDVRWATAVHEAGHAVAHLTFGHTIAALHVDPPDGDPWAGDHGRVVSQCPCKIRLICDPVTTWAGPIAHREALRRVGLLTPANIIGTARTADPDARAVASCRLSEAADRAAREHATRIVDQHWPGIERLAEAPADTGALSGEEATDLAERSTTGGRPIGGMTGVPGPGYAEGP